MSEIILCNQPLSLEALEKNCGIVITTNGYSNEIKNIEAYSPYALGELSATSKKLLTHLRPKTISRNLTHLSLSLGSENVVNVSDVTAKLSEYNVGLLGASTSVYANRVGGFVGDVKSYQNALMEYQKTLKSNSVLRNTAKQKAYRAFNKMQKSFQYELSVVSAKSRSRKGTPLTNPVRAANIIRSSRNVAKLNLVNDVQANNLIRFTKHTKLLGNGLAVIDFGSRVGNIHTSYVAGDNWERELFIESTSFATSAIAGTAAVNVGTAALGFLVVATPIGWVGLIVGGVAVAGVAAGVSMGVNSYVKENSGDTYDQIMRWLGL